MAGESYDGAANRETFFFNMHWQNNSDRYHETLREARKLQATYAEDTLTDHALGDHIVDYWRNRVENELFNARRPISSGHWAWMWLTEVGSWWRIDRSEVASEVHDALGIEA